MTKKNMGLLVLALLLPLAACGYKGKLKSPSEIAAEEEKAARKAAKQAEKPQAAPAKESQ